MYSHEKRAFFSLFWRWLTSQQILPRLFYFDAVGDLKLIIICHPGTGVSVDGLHILEKNPDQTLTSYALPWEFFSEDLSKALSVKTANGRTYSILEGELVSYRDGVFTLTQIHLS